MAVAFEIRRDWGFVMVSLTGKVTPDDHIRSFVAYSRHPDFHPDQNVLMNLRDFDFDNLFFEQLLAVASKLETLYGVRSDSVRTAIYAPGDTAFGMSRMYQSITEGRARQSSSVFRKIGPALDYIGLAQGSAARDWVLDRLDVAPRPGARPAQP